MTQVASARVSAEAYLAQERKAKERIMASCFGLDLTSLYQRLDNLS